MPTTPTFAEPTNKTTLYAIKSSLFVALSIDIEGSDLSRAMAMNDSLLTMLIEEWSLSIPVPAIKPDSIDELEIVDYDALVEYTKEAQQALFPNLADTPENEADPKVPTENSNA